MKKRFLVLILLVLLAAALPLLASAEIVDSGSCGDNLTWTLTDDGLLTISGTGEMTQNPWAWCGTQVVNVVIEDGVTNICDYAFSSNGDLRSVTIPASVTSIGEGSFRFCEALTEIAIPSTVNTIGSHAFTGCDLTELTIPDSVTSIDQYAFNANRSLTNVTIGNGITSLSEGVFESCSSLTDVTIPANVANIGLWCFNDCPSLTNVTIANPEAEISGGAFNSSDTLTIYCYSDSTAKTYAEEHYIPCELLDNPTTGRPVITVQPASQELYEGETVAFQVVADNAETYQWYYRSSVYDNIWQTVDEEMAASASLSFTADMMRDGYQYRCRVSNSVGEAYSHIVTLTVQRDLTKCGDNLHWSVDSDGVLTISGTGAMYDYDYGTAPWGNAITGISLGEGVTSIGRLAFYGCQNLTSVTIPDSVTEMRMEAFRDSGLTEITIGNGVTCIRVMTFESCHNLTSVTIPEGVTTIGDYAFNNCSNLTDVVIPASVTSIGEWAFNCYNIQNVTINGLDTAFNGDVFCGQKPYLTLRCNSGSTAQQYAIDHNIRYRLIGETLTGACGDSLTWTLDDNDVLTISGTGAMDDYEYMNENGNERSTAPWGGLPIASVVIENGVTSIGSHAFYHCNTISSATIPNSVTAIGEHAFQECENLTSAPIPAGVTSIGQYAFFCCYNLADVTIPSGITSIGDYTFSHCIMTSAVIPDGVTSIDHAAFYGCTELVSVTIPESVTNIGEAAFNRCPNLTDVNIPDGVTDIGRQAFSGCSSLTSLTVPASVINIGDAAFNDSPVTLGVYRNSAALAYARDNYVPYVILDLASSGAYGENLTWSMDANGVLTISGNGPMVDGFHPWGNEGITAVIIEEGVTTVGSGVFASAYGLQSVTIPSSVTEINNDAFRYCRSLSSVVIPNGVTRIDNFAFSDCQALTSVVIPGSVTSLGNNVFSYCPNLTSITIPNSVTSMGNGVFDGDQNLTSVTLPNRITRLGDGFFQDCRSLTTVTIPDSVCSIGFATFYYCTSLTDITIPDGVSDIDRNAFYNCVSLTSATILGSQTNIVDSAFDRCANLTISCYDGSTAQRFALDHGFAVALLPDTRPQISSQPVDQILDAGETATFSVTANNVESYQWYYRVSPNANWQAVEGDAARTANLSVPADMAHHKHQYRCLLQNSQNRVFTNVATLRALAYEGSCGENLTWTIAGDVLTISGTGAMDHYAHETMDGTTAPWAGRNISTVVLGNGVTSIGNFAFNKCEALTSVTIPGSVAGIGNNALSYCPNLTGIVIPDSVTSMGNGVFDGDQNLTSVTLSNSIPRLGDGFFQNCRSLVSVTIPSSVTSIGNDSFGNCESLTSLTIPDSVTSIANRAIYNCPNLVVSCNIDSAAHHYCSNNNISVKLLDAPTSGQCGENLTWAVADGVLTISGTGPMNDYSWYQDPMTSEWIENSPPWLYTSFSSVVLENGVTSIGDLAFDNCAGLVSVTIPDSVTRIGFSAFYNCSRLTSVTIPSSVTVIEDWTFEMCTSLTSVTIPESVTSIGYGAFYGCSNLTSITIPDSVTRIDEYAFDNCPKLVVTCNYNSEAYLYCKNRNIRMNALNVPVPTSGQCGENLTWAVADGVLTISGTGPMDQYVYSYWDIDKQEEFYILRQRPWAYTDFSSLVLENGVTSIGAGAFISCSSLANVTIPDTVTSIEQSAFSNCTSLTGITIPASVTSIGESLFNNSPNVVISCYGASAAHTYAVNNHIAYVLLDSPLTAPDFVVPGALTAIEEEAFSGIAAKRVKLSENTAGIGSKAFADCPNLVSIYIPVNCTDIAADAFSGVSDLTIFAPAGSTAAGYATTNGYKLVTTEE